MKKLLFSIATIVALLSSLSSCLGDGVEYEVSDEAAITSFKLGTQNQYLVTKAKDGQDSTYKQTVDCSVYSFNIDHHKGLIWNTDSLPVGIDAAKIICTALSRGGGGIGIKSLTSDSINVYNETDSIDFTKERTFVVYSPSLRGKREYKVTVNVHQQHPDSCYWTRMASENEDFKAMTDMKAINMNGKIYLFGNIDGEARVFCTDINDGIVWNAITTEPALDTESSKSVITRNGKFYTIASGEILSSTDGATWHAICSTTLKQLVAASTVRLYALSAEGMLMSSTDDGETWMEEQLDDDASLLPSESIAYSSYKAASIADTDRIVLIGNRSMSEFPADTTAVVWTKVEEYGNGAREHVWNYVDALEKSHFKAPRGKNWQLFNYDGTVKALIGKAEGNCKHEAHKKFYYSADNGITWRPDTTIALPQGFESSETDFAVTTDENRMIWIICSGSGQVWKGRINRVAWKKENED